MRDTLVVNDSFKQHGTLLPDDSFSLYVTIDIVDLFRSIGTLAPVDSFLYHVTVGIFDSLVD